MSLRIAFDPIYAHPLPEGHRFPMLKYELIPGQLLYEGAINASNLFSPGICPNDIVLLTHNKEYLDKLHNQTLSAKEQRHIGFPQSPQLTKRELIITQGTIDCCHYACEYGVALNVAGGTHHAFRERGEGFCLLNDFAVAANYLLHTGRAKKYSSLISMFTREMVPLKFSNRKKKYSPSACTAKTTILFTKKKATWILSWQTVPMMKPTWEF